MSRFERTKPHVTIPSSKAMAAGWAAPRNRGRSLLCLAIRRALYGS